ncbi:hypothetical protein BHE74_00046734 [Ensete ventricosum]|nr:hypothetical protein BHE74_00046734 [Ensete ventricosum]
MRTVHYRAVPPNGEVSAPLSLEIDRRQSSSGQYRPLLGGTADWSGFHLITTQNWSKKREKRKREKKRENLESGVALPIPICCQQTISSPCAGRRNVSKRGEME